MTLPNNTFTKRKNILLFFIAISLIITIIGPVEIMLGFFYLKNGKSFMINDYQIKMSFMHWAYFGESKITYIVTGKNINSNNLSAEFFKEAEKLNILNAISNCDSIEQKTYEGIRIKGNIYLCMKNRKETMYFQSNDKKILIREDDYNSSNTEIVKEYVLLFENIEKIKNKGVKQ